MSIFSNRHVKFGQMLVWLGCILIQIASALPIVADDDDILTDTVSILQIFLIIEIQAIDLDLDT